LHLRVQKIDFCMEKNFSFFLKKNYKKYMGIDLPPHAICMQRLKFVPFVDPEQPPPSQSVAELVQFDVLEP